MTHIGLASGSMSGKEAAGGPNEQSGLQSQRVGLGPPSYSGLLGCFIWFCGFRSYCDTLVTTGLNTDWGLPRAGRSLVQSSGSL